MPRFSCTPNSVSTPGHHESAGKQRSGKAKPGPKWLQRSLTEAAKAAGRTKGTYLEAQYARLRGRRGPARATKAVGHSILVASFHMLSSGTTYQDLGADWFGRLRPQQHARRSWSTNSRPLATPSRSAPGTLPDSFVAGLATAFRMFHQ